MTNIITETYPKKLRGYIQYPRQELLLLQLLTDSQYSLYQTIKILVTDWDNRHVLYGHFYYDIEQIKFYIGWLEPKIRRIFNSLVELGFIKMVDKKRRLYLISNFEAFNKISRTRNPKYILELLEAVVKEISENNNKKLGEFETTISNLKNILPSEEVVEPNNTPISKFNIGSYKGDVGSKTTTSTERLSEGDIDEIIKILDGGVDT